MIDKVHSGSTYFVLALILCLVCKLGHNYAQGIDASSLIGLVVFLSLGLAFAISTKLQ